MRRNYIILFLFAYFAFSVFAKLEIEAPSGLKTWWEANEDATHSSLASFGEIPWRQNISGRLGLSNPIDACSYLELDSNTNHVQPILVAVRGNCPFTLKAHYAQVAGAKLLVIVDNVYEDVETHLLTAPLEVSKTIHIPSILLDKRAGEKLVDSLNSANLEVNTIVGTFDFTIPKLDNVEYHLWLTSSNQLTFKFLKDWKQYYDRLSSITVMQPHFGYSKYYDPASTSDTENCLCGFSYCAEGSDRNLSNTGRDVLLEDLRQICLLRGYGLDTWWRYIFEYAETCLSVDKDMADCSRSALLKIEVDPDIINSCVLDSFDNTDLERCKKNVLLDNEDMIAYQDGLFMFPSVIINNRFTYRGNLVPAKGVFESICESFNTMPNVCTSENNPSLITGSETSSNQENTSTVTESIPSPKSDGNGFPTVIVVVVCSLVFALLILFLYRRSIKKQGGREAGELGSQFIHYE